jgi:organic hydroperoxide reductase OsmC/OhrA
MDSFAEERTTLENKNKDLQKLLNQATKVCLLSHVVLTLTSLGHHLLGGAK